MTGDDDPGDMDFTLALLDMVVAMRPSVSVPSPGIWANDCAILSVTSRGNGISSGKYLEYRRSTEMGVMSLPVTSRTTIMMSLSLSYGVYRGLDPGRQ